MDGDLEVSPDFRNRNLMEKLVGEYCKVRKELEELEELRITMGNVEDAHRVRANRATPILNSTKAGKEPKPAVNRPKTSNAVKHWTRLCKESINPDKTNAHGVRTNAHGVRASYDALGDPLN